MDIDYCWSDAGRGADGDELWRLSGRDGRRVRRREDRPRAALSAAVRVNGLYGPRGRTVERVAAAVPRAHRPSGPQRGAHAHAAGVRGPPGARLHRQDAPLEEPRAGSVYCAISMIHLTSELITLNSRFNVDTN